MSDSRSQFGLGTLRLYWDILRLRRGPEDLPVSAALLLATVVARVAVGLGLSAISPEPERHALALIVIDTFVLLFWGRALLHLARRPERYLQTMTAVFGCKLLLQVLLAPVSWFYVTYSKDPNLGAVAALLVAAFGVWALVVNVRILRSATDWPVLGCVGAAILPELLTTLVAVSMFPELMPKPAS